MAPSATPQASHERVLQRATQRVARGGTNAEHLSPLVFAMRRAIADRDVDQIAYVESRMRDYLGLMPNPDIVGRTLSSTPHEPREARCRLHIHDPSGISEQPTSMDDGPDIPF